jgi:hypothetical protein
LGLNIYVSLGFSRKGRGFFFEKFSWVPRRIAASSRGCFLPIRFSETCW